MMDRITRSGLLLSVVCLLFGPVCEAGTVRHDRPAERYQGLGRVFTPSVGRLLGRDGDRYYSASGTLVHQRWVVTAAHVVDGLDDLRVELYGRDYEAEGWVTAPGWDGDGLSNRDLALVRLNEPVRRGRVVPLFNGAAGRNRTVISVGHGRSGSGRIGYNPASLFFPRGGTNRLDGKLDGGVLTTDFDGPGRRWPNRTGSSRPTDLEINAAPGDSGGALFARQLDAWALIGVTAFGLAYDGNVNGSYGDLTAYTSIDANAQWINRVLASGGSTTSRWPPKRLRLRPPRHRHRPLVAPVVPTPSAAALGILGMLLIVSAGKRRDT